MSRRVSATEPSRRRRTVGVVVRVALLALVATGLTTGPAEAATVRVAPDVPRLRVGSMPTLPYVDWPAKRIVDGSRRVSISGIQGRVVELHKVAGGYLLRRDLSDATQDLVFVATSGARKAILRLLGPRAIRVSLDGDRVVVNRLRREAGTLVYADTAVLAVATGAELQVHDFGTYQPSLHLFGTGRVLLTVSGTQTTDPDVAWWTPSGDLVDVVRPAAVVETADLSAWHWALRPMVGVYGVHPIPSDDGPGWTVSQEDWNLYSWSTDDALIWGNNEITDQAEGYGSSSYLVHRASDGQLVLAIRNVVDPWATWESDESLLLRAAYGTGSARRWQLIRCRLSGACSRVGAASTTPQLTIIAATRRG